MSIVVVNSNSMWQRVFEVGSYKIENQNIVLSGGVTEFDMFGGELPNSPSKVLIIKCNEWNEVKEISKECFDERSKRNKEQAARSEEELSRALKEVDEYLSHRGKGFWGSIFGG